MTVASIGNFYFQNIIEALCFIDFFNHRKLLELAPNTYIYLQLNSLKNYIILVSTKYL